MVVKLGLMKVEIYGLEIELEINLIEEVIGKFMIKERRNLLEIKEKLLIRIEKF
jgi:hypothetical protein